MRFTPHVHYCLRQAGWHPGRRERLNEEVLSWYPPDHPALKVLEEFGDLQILESSLYYNRDYGGHIDVFGDPPTNKILGELRSNGPLLNTVLAFTGYVQTMDRIIIANDGSVYKCYEDNTLWYWAPNFDDFLNRNLMGEKRAAFPPHHAPGNWKWVT